MAESRAFSEALAFGKDGEHRIAQALLRRGNTVVPLYQYLNHDAAPVALLPNEQNGVRAVILPDLTVWSINGTVRFVEVKRKQRWVSFMPHLETGFNAHLFDEYLTLQRRTKTPIHVFFLHEVQPPTGVFVGNLEEMAQRVRIWNGKAQALQIIEQDHELRVTEVTRHVTKALALFPFDTLKRLWTLEELERLVTAAA